MIIDPENEVNEIDLLAQEIYGELPTQVRAFLPVDSHNFLSEVDVFRDLIQIIQPKIIIEVGSWKGHSAIKTAETLHNLNLYSSRVLCVDTWLGSLEHWQNENWRKELYLEHGYPTLYQRFLNNVIHSGLAKYIIPFPMIAEMAATFFQQRQIKADLIYIDAAHDYKSVTNDLHNFYALLNPDGIVFGDNFPYPPTGDAVRDFAIDKDLGLMVQGRKFILFRDDQLSKFSQQSSWNLVLEANSSKSKAIQLLPISQSEIINTNNEELIFSEEALEKIYVFEVNSDESKESVMGTHSNIIEPACFAPASANVSVFGSSTYTPRPIYFARLPWALMFFPCSLVISQWSRYWKDSLYLAPFKNFPQIIQEKQEILLLKMKKNVTSRIISDTTILLTFHGYNNYYHWHTNILPIAFYLKDKINSGKFHVISHLLNEWQRISLSMLGIDLSVIEQVGQSTILCRSLIYSSYLSGIAFQLPQSIKYVFERLKNCCSDKIKTLNDSPELIFISREDASNRRSLLNEAEVFNALEPRGFVKVTPGSLSYEQQIQTFAKAKVIVAQHGAGLTNMGFAPSSCKVIEILSENYINSCFWRLTQVLGNEYAYVIAEVEEKYKDLNPHLAKFSVPVDAVVNAVSHV